GTKWTEIRLDTVLYDGWYSKIGQDWIPNFKMVQYYVEGDTVVAPFKYMKIYCTEDTEKASLIAFVTEDTDYCHSVGISCPYYLTDNDESPTIPYPAYIYYFCDWKEGDILEGQSLWGAQCDCFPPRGIVKYGIVRRIFEEELGGSNVLKYVDFEGLLLIHGIGVTKWADKYCILGPANIDEVDYAWKGEEKPRNNYLSMLVHFERGGEVLYDVWPTPEGTNSLSPNPSPIEKGAVYDLSGRKINLPQPLQRRGTQGLMPKGVYIVNGKKVLIK
nr:hypothetical protein [Bacteroidaceae bacterium]